MRENLNGFVGVCAEFAPLEGNANLKTFLDFLDVAEASEDPIPLAATASPFHFIIAQPSAKIARIEPIEYLLKIKIFSFMAQVQMPLHWKLRMRQFTFGSFCHST